MKGLKKQAGIIAGLTALLAPLTADAITLLPPCTSTGDCGITDILIVFVNVTEFLLGIVGAVALAYFIYGGITLLLSAGKQEQIGKGKTIIRNAVIGIAIIFLSGAIVRFTTSALTGTTSGAVCTVREGQQSCSRGNRKCELPEKCELSGGCQCFADQGVSCWARAGSNTCTDADGKTCTLANACDDKAVGFCPCGGIPIVGQSCNTIGVGGQASGQAGIYLTIPAGCTDINNCRNTTAPETVLCIAKEATNQIGGECQDLNRVLAHRNRSERFRCLDVKGDNVTSCVRGLCKNLGADIACCLTK